MDARGPVAKMWLMGLEREVPRTVVKLVAVPGSSRRCCCVVLCCVVLCCVALCCVVLCCVVLCCVVLCCVVLCCVVLCCVVLCCAIDAVCEILGLSAAMLDRFAISCE